MSPVTAKPPIDSSTSAGRTAVPLVCVASGVVVVDPAPPANAGIDVVVVATVVVVVGAAVVVGAGGGAGAVVVGAAVVVVVGAAVEGVVSEVVVGAVVDVVDGSMIRCAVARPVPSTSAAVTISKGTSHRTGVV
jgi:hypothetical protein